MLVRIIGFTAAIVWACAATASAHHSQSMYDGETDLESTGIVEAFEWSNPHSWLYLMIEDETGTPRQWSFETNSTGQLSRVGWAADSMRAGDEVTVVFHPLRDDTRGGSIVAVHLADGTVLPSGGQRNDPIRGSDAIIP
jgi:hypothetical protein